MFGAGKDIIFLHGFGSSSDSFLTIANKLKTTYRVTLIDMYGTQKTKHPDRVLTLEDYAQSILEIIQHYKMENFTLVGHSFGGRVILKMYERLKDKISKIVLVDSAGLKPRRGLIYYYKVYRHKILRFLKIRHKAGSKDYNSLSDIEKKSFINIVNEDFTHALKTINTPTLIVWGDKDKTTPMYMAKKFHKKIKNSKLIILHGEHFAYLENMLYFVYLLKSFIL